ncbi:MAG: IS200/IS605 family transposase [Pirellulales bacterium]
MANTFTNLLYHVVFSTKTRLPLIDARFENELHDYMGGIIRNLGGVQIEIGGVADHIHLLMKCKPSMSLSDIVRDLKGGSAKWLNETHFELRKFGWQEGYAAFTVSESRIDAVIKYIRNQKTTSPQAVVSGRIPYVIGEARNRVRRTLSVGLI